MQGPESIELSSEQESLGIEALRAIEESLPKYMAAVEYQKKTNRNVEAVLAEGMKCNICETEFIRVKRPYPKEVVEHFGEVYGLACKPCNASVYPPPEVYLMSRADEFLEGGMLLRKQSTRGTVHIHVILFLLYHAVELYLKCLGTHTYYIGSKRVEMDPLHTDTEERPEEEAKGLVHSHSLSKAFMGIPRSSQERLKLFEKGQKSDIKRIIESMPEAIGLFGRYPWISEKHERALATVKHNKQEVVSVLEATGKGLKRFATAELALLY